VRIQQTLQLFLATKFEEGTQEIKALMKELSVPHQRHLLCFANMQLTISMHLRQDVLQFMNAFQTGFQVQSYPGGPSLRHFPSEQKYSLHRK
jgi:hypothetical protein